MKAIDEENLSSTIVKRSLVLLTLLTAIAFGVYSLNAALGVLTGGLIAIVNFLWMGNTLKRTLGILPDSPLRYSLLRFLSRMTVLGLVLYLALTSGWISIIGLVVGLSVIVANIVALSLFRLHGAGE
jgi:hypothetical protein